MTSPPRVQPFQTMYKILRLCALFLLTTWGLHAAAQRNVYAFEVKDYQGKTVKLSDYRGQVMLIVNTATQCGFTPQYEAIEQLYRDYHKRGLVVLDFPCNQFGAQAPGSDEEIHQFCTSTYATSFPQMQKVEVNGEAAHSLYKYLKRKAAFTGFDQKTPRGLRMHQMMKQRDADYEKKPDIKWNFTKFLIDRRGRVVKRFEPTAPIEQIEAAVQQLLR